MFRSLHMKLVMIMVLLIVSLMAVVGTFLINSTVRFYVNDFYEQINRVTGENSLLASVLQVEGSNETAPQTYDPSQTATSEGLRNPVKILYDALVSYMGQLGVDCVNRNFYILEGSTGRVWTNSASNPTALASDSALSGGTDEPLPNSIGSVANITPNLAAAIAATVSGNANGFVSDDCDLTADYMDVAICFTRGDYAYILYILDSRETVRSLTSELFLLIVEAMALGLLIAIPLSLLLAKTIITPIQRLTDAAKRVAAGDFGKRIEVDSKDEIGILTENFNSMARQLKDTLAAVENERNKLDTLFLHMTDGVVAFSHDGQVIHWNPAAMEMLGRRIDEHTTYQQLFDAPLPLLDLMGTSQDGYVEQERRVEGRHLECICALFDRAGQGGVLVVIHDVTEQRRVEEQRREFVANVSHELRTPLTNIRSYAETLADGAADMPREMEHNFLQVILNESDRMTHIVQDLLTLSRFDSGHSELKLARFSFDGAVRDTYNAILMEAQRHSHTVTLDIQPGVPSILGDRERILQVMMNIVSNAIKYTPDGGLIRISAGLSGAKVWMEVDDNGIGIPQEDRGRIFERFYRVDKARSRESGGTGLGLSIAKEIVDRHHGVLTLVDKEAPGLTIRMELPVDGPGEAAS